jgi:CheY-like chemotaxis protein
MNANQTGEMVVLVAEDEDNDFYLLQRALQLADTKVRVERATDGLEALRYLRGEAEFADRDKYPAPKIVLLDLKMPRMTGMEVLHWIKDNPMHKVTPTVVLSSSMQPHDVQSAYELGANTYFLKPTKFDDLIDLCRTILRYWSYGVKPQVK